MPHATPTVVRTTLNYHLRPEDGLQKVITLGAVAENRRKHVPALADITDIRGIEDDFSLDKQGFQVVQNDSPLVGEEYDDEKRVKDEYFRSCAEVIKLT